MILERGKFYEVGQKVIYNKIYRTYRINKIKQNEETGEFVYDLLYERINEYRLNVKHSEIGEDRRKFNYSLREQKDKGYLKHLKMGHPDDLKDCYEVGQQIKDRSNGNICYIIKKKDVVINSYSKRNFCYFHSYDIFDMFHGVILKDKKFWDIKENYVFQKFGEHALENETFSKAFFFNKPG